MPFLLQSDSAGQVQTFPLDSFARVGAASGCDVVVISRTMPAHAVTIVEEGADVCRIVVKSPGVTINGEPRPESSSLLLTVGQTIEVNGVTFLLLTAPTEPDTGSRYAAAAEVVQHVLPGAEIPDTPPETEVAAQKGAAPSEGSVAVQIAAILLCLAIVAGLVGWMFFGDALTGESGPAAASRVNLATAITQIQAEKNWPWKSIGQAEMLAALQNIYRLESQGRIDEARTQLLKVRTKLLEDVPQDKNGLYVIQGEAKPATGGTEGSQPASVPATAVGTDRLSGILFPEASRRELYELIVKKHAELLPPQ